MEDVLEVYHRRHDPARPLFCFDGAAKQPNLNAFEVVPSVRPKSESLSAKNETELVDTLKTYP